VTRFVRTYSVELALVSALALAVLFFGYLAVGLFPRDAGEEDFAGSRALAAAGRQMAFGARTTATQSNLDMGAWLIEQLTSAGWDVVIQQFSAGEVVKGRNLIAIRSPAQPLGATAPAAFPVGILATHYDTRLAADSDPLPENQTSPAPGANNGASGVAVLLELARTLDVDESGHTLCLAFFDADANDGLPGWQGRLGSSHFARTVAQDVPRCAAPAFVVALDQVGGDNARFRQDANGDPALNAAIWAQAEALGFNDTFLPETAPATPNAHTPLQQNGVPGSLITDVGYTAGATLADTVDRLSEATLLRVGRTLEAWLERGAQFGDG